MTNKNYQSGRRFEYEVRDCLRNLGYVVIRAAGSHSPFDLVALRSDQVLLLQCKITTTEAARLREVKKFMESPPFKPYNFPCHQGIASRTKGNTEIHFSYT